MRKRDSLPPSSDSRPSKRTRQQISENEEGRDSGASEDDNEVHTTEVPSKDLAKHPMKYFDTTLSDSMALTFDASKVMNVIEDDLPHNPADPNSWGLSQLCFLLIGFVQGSKGALDTKYTQLEAARGVLKAHPELRDILVTAWDKKEYDRVLNLEFLHTESNLTASSSGLSDWQQVQLLSALNEPYQGFAVDGFYEYLTQNNHDYLNKNRKYYAKFCSIVQSSGTGKTRVILELAQRGVLVLYMNLRPQADDSGYPVRDQVPASILTGFCESEKEYHIQCCAFFASIFKLIRDDIKQLKSDGSAVVENWNKHMMLKQSYRDEFFERLQTSYHEIKNKFHFKKDANKMSGYSNTTHRAEMEQDLQYYYKEFTKVLGSAFSNVDGHLPKLVIALDEAHTLHEKVDFRRSTVLLRVIKSYSAPRSPHSVWVVFASTTSKVAEFSSPQTLFDSARVSIEGELIFRPFCQLGWDHHAPALGTVPPTEVAKVKHILRYGRPLWESLKRMTAPSGIFDLASEKLIGKTEYNGSNDQHALVVLAQRFGLDICFGHRESVHFVESTVASHMRVCVTTTENRLWSYTAYPSEPILSCAAVDLMHRTEGSLVATLNTLKLKMKDGMIDIGKCGELVSRLIWLLAKDFMIRNQNIDGQHPIVGDTSDAELVDCCMVPVVEFIEFVFGNDFWGKVEDGAGSDAKEAFRDAYVNFSHWVSMESFIRRDKSEDQLDLNEWTMRHWQRTCAVQCCQNQPSIDKVIPIYFKSAKPGLKGMDCVSQILISDKARTSRDAHALSKIQRSDSTIGGEELPLNRLPYIGIVADLRLKDTGLESVTFPTRTSARTTTDAQCLRIRACGLGEKSYPFFKDYPGVLQQLQSLLEWERNPPKSNRPLGDQLQNQVQYGSSGEGRHMRWE